LICWERQAEHYQWEIVLVTNKFMEKEDKEEKLPRFENKGSVGYLKDFDKETDKGRKTCNFSFACVTLIIIFSKIFDFISTGTTVIGLLIVVLIWIVYGYLFKILMLENFYTRAKIGALEDEINNL